MQSEEEQPWNPSRSLLCLKFFHPDSEQRRFCTSSESRSSSPRSTDDLLSLITFLPQILLELLEGPWIGYAGERYYLAIIENAPEMFRSDLSGG